MSITNFPNGVSSFGIPQIGNGDMRSVTGKVFWVDSAEGEDATGNGTFEAPFDSIDYAVGVCTASRGDLILVKEGHAETVSAAGGLDLDVAGITIRGLGNGDNRPTISIGTATTADIDVDAADIALENVVVKCAINALAVMFDVNAARFTLRDSEILITSTSLAAVDCIVTGATTASNGLRVINNDFRAEVDGADTVIDIVGTPDRVEISGNRFRGAYDEATVHNATGNIATNAVLTGNYIENTDATAQAVDLDSACTGWAANNLWDVPNIDPGAAAQVDMGAMKLFENYGVDAVDVSAILHPAAT